jgi:hypothetical protein
VIASGGNNRAGAARPRELQLEAPISPKNARAKADVKILTSRSWRVAEIGPVGSPRAHLGTVGLRTAAPTNYSEFAHALDSLNPRRKLTNTSEDFVISSLGWVDGRGLWTFRLGEQRVRRVVLEDAKYLTLHAGTEDHFSVVHRGEGSRIEITVHNSGDSGAPLDRAVVEAAGSTVSGRPSILPHVESALAGT